MSELYIIKAFIGILFLYLGANSLVKGSLNVSCIMCISPLIAGLTIVSIGTSLPEFVVSLAAQYKPGGSDIAITNIIGSNIGNIGLVLSLSILLFPLRVINCIQIKEFVFLISTSLIVFLLSLLGSVPFIMGPFLICLLFYYIYCHYKDFKNSSNNRRVEVDYFSFDIIMAILMILCGSILLFLGGNFLIESAVILSKHWNLSNRFIGITLVAVGTSLPELSASLVAAFNKQHHIALGNVIGSNIFNILFVLGFVNCLRPINHFNGAIVVDALFMFLFTLLLICMVFKSKGYLSRSKGALLLFFYISYIAILFINSPYVLTCN